MRFGQLSCGSKRPAKCGGACAPVLKPCSLLDLAAGRFDRRPRAFGRRDALQRYGLLDLTGKDHFGLFGKYRNHVCLLQSLEVDHRALDLGQLAQHDLGASPSHLRAEADLRHPALDRHLAAFESDLVVATLAGALALRAAAAGLALASGRTTPHAQAWTLGSIGRLQCLKKTHDLGALVYALRATIVQVTTTCEIWGRFRAIPEIPFKSSRLSANAPLSGSTPGSPGCQQRRRSGESCAGRGRAPKPRCSRAARAGS